MTQTSTPPAAAVRFELKFRRVEVSKVDPITDRYLRVTLTGEDLADFATLNPADHFKLAFQDDPATDPVIPSFGENGWDYPAGAQRPHLRDYTPRRFDPVNRELEVDFVIHGEGPASTWAAQAKVGQKLAVVGPRGSRPVDYGYDWFLLIGDETAWPSIFRRLAESPAGAKILAFVESDDELPYSTTADATVTWVRRDAAPGSSSTLERTVRTAEFPAGNVFAWAGGEANTLRSIRRYLKNEAGIPEANLKFSGHWKRGVANYDHHEPIGE